ncbi:enoyl-CoA hydratase [Desulfitobacterium metallireducens DSM 15288]|uniref:Enoyl-CoA hydratase n=1 Tax=Desulfitobacterium metallireducens DSM 15288 TaxID=871968 RepID=W0EGD5_9FIRM|nr:enoyl-CoA hydratase/isomerase family protein [Desulfitobacterium metallireducens]AHF08126.1 enoyl-CoA hydratase [Desulfitobacterium metallireducens DSM 15288]
MSYRDFNLEFKNQVALVTLNRPEKGNSWTKETYLEMEELQTELQRNEEVRAIVFTGAGDKFFCAGADLALLSELNSHWISLELSRFQAINTRWERHIKPVIMAVNGITVGSGLELALSGDIRIASSEATFSINEVRLGLNPDMGGTQRLTRVVGPSQAKRLILTAETLDAQEAARIGLVDCVVPAKNLISEALKMAERITYMPPLAVRFAKKAINLAVDTPLEMGLMYEEVASTFCMGTEDKKEAVQSVLEKRQPEFYGK